MRYENIRKALYTDHGYLGTTIKRAHSGSCTKNWVVVVVKAIAPNNFFS